MTPCFRGELTVSPYPDGKTWYLDQPFAYVRDGGEIAIPAGFETDWASVPQALQNVFPRWDVYGPAAVVHDWLYWNQQTTRAEADGIFMEAMEVLAVVSWKRWALYGAVRAFGQYAWDDNALIAAEGYSRVRTAASPPVPEWHR